MTWRTYARPSILLCILFLIASPPLAAGELGSHDFRYVIEFPQTVIEGDVVDNETGDLVGGAKVVGEVHPEATPINVTTDDDGHFMVVLPEGNDHTYILNISAPGYDPRTITGSIRSGERKYLRIPIQYNPFDVQLTETSGSLARGYTSSSYSGRRSIPFLTQRTVPVLDASGNPVYDTVVEKVLTGYTWEEKVTKYKTVTASLPASAGEWVDTGETFTEGWFNPKPSLPPGYRWVEVSRGYTLGIWTTTTFKKQYNAVEYWRSQGYSVTANTERYVSGYVNEEYREWVPGHNETKTRTVTKYRTETYRSWEQTGTKTESYPEWVSEGHWEWRWLWFIPYPVWVDTSHWETRTRTVPVYGWVTHTRQVPYTVTETYQEWVPGRWVTKTRQVPVYSTRITGYTATKQVPYEVWETKSSSTPPILYKPGTMVPRDDIRNLKEIYTTTTKQAPRTRVETYTAYKVYDYGGTFHSYLPWGEKQATVIATPKNGYTGDIRLVVETDNGVSAKLDSGVLTFSSTASTTLRMTPNYASAYTIVVKAHDSNDRLVRTLAYELEATEESLSPPRSWERYLGTTEQPDDIPATITSTSTSAVDVEMSELVFTSVSNVTYGPVYDGGSVGGTITRFFTVDYMYPIRPDGTLNYINEKAWEYVYGNNLEDLSSDIGAY